LNAAVTFVAGIAIGVALMAFIESGDHAAAQATRDKELDTVRADLCRSLGYDHVEQVNGRWGCMDVDPEGDHDHDHEGEDAD
jgi:hypothetical protein